MKFFLVAILFCFTHTSFAQTNADAFPASYIGEWKGESNYYVEKGFKRTDHAGVKIFPVKGKPNEYTWQFMIYEDWAKNDRIYILKPAGDQPNHWLLNEQDGIVFDCYSFGNAFQSVIEIKGEMHCMNFKLVNGKLYVDVTTTEAELLPQTGKGTDLVPFGNSRKVKKFETGFYERQP